jgi:hypothetical protein
MKIFGLNIETVKELSARQTKNSEDVFVAYLNGIKDGMRMVRDQEVQSQYLKAAQEYNPRNIH